MAIMKEKAKTGINFTAFLRDLFFVETECTLSFAIIGTVFARGATISYAHFFIPLLLGLVCMVPCLPVYLKEDLTIPQVMLQRSLELIVLEAVCVWTAQLLAGNFLGIAGLCAVAFSVLFFDVAAYFFMYRMEKAESERLNRKLQMLVESQIALERTSSEEVKTEDKKSGKIEAIGEHGSHVQLALAELLYFEADHEQVFAYTLEEIYKVNMRLYQVEELSRPAGIIRVSKSHLVNLQKILSVRPALNSRLYAKMLNGEEVLVSRKYAPHFKEAIEPLSKAV